MNAEEFTGNSKSPPTLSMRWDCRHAGAARRDRVLGGAAALFAGFQAIASGYYRRVLVLAGEKMTHLNTSTTTRVLAEVIDPEERLCGATMPALAAMITEKYRRKYHLSQSRLENMLCTVASKNHLNGTRNPLAQFQKAISRDDYFNSKFVATPLRLYDCAPITDGAAAVVLSATKPTCAFPASAKAPAHLACAIERRSHRFPPPASPPRALIRWPGYRPMRSILPRCMTPSHRSKLLQPKIWDFSPPAKAARRRSKKNRHRRHATDQSIGRFKSARPSGRRQRLGAGRRSHQRVRGEQPLKRPPRRGLTQSTGGLATNNLLPSWSAPTRRKHRSGASPPSPLVGKAVVNAPAPPLRRRRGYRDVYDPLHNARRIFAAAGARADPRPPGDLLMAQGEDKPSSKSARRFFFAALTASTCSR